MTETLKTTPLFELQRQAGARFVPFAGWKMPVQFAGIPDEHHVVRRGVGIFDTSHMGELEVRGPGAVELVQYAITNDLGRIGPGQAQYTVVCREDGGILDDLIVYRIADDRVFICMNASNRAKIVDHFVELGRSRGVEVVDRSDDFAQIAIQGPASDSIVAALFGDAVVALGSFHFVELAYQGETVIVARTGYTGERGVEVFAPPALAPAIWQRCVEAGAAPCGLGCRDTLRLEMGYCLYGNDIDETTNPLEAGLSWVVRLKAGDFLGRDALLQVKKAGVARRLVGLRLNERAIARSHYKIVSNGSSVGEITSGSLSLSLDIPIAMGYVPVELSAPGSEVGIEIRKKTVAAEVVTTPFYRNSSL